MLEVLADKRTRTEALKRRLGEAIRYPLFVLGAAGCVLLFFLAFVLPQFAGVLQDFGAKVDPFILGFLNFSTFLRANSDAVMAVLAAVIAIAWLLLRQESVRRGLTNAADTAAGDPRGDEVLPDLAVLPKSRSAARQRRQPHDDAAHPGRHDGVGRLVRVWADAADRVRHGAKLSDALAETQALPAMAVRMLQTRRRDRAIADASARVAEFYEAKLQRTLDRVVGIAGPAAIIVISIVVGGLIVSVMTALMSVSQIVG